MSCGDNYLLKNFMSGLASIGKKVPTGMLSVVVALVLSGAAFYSESSASMAAEETAKAAADTHKEEGHSADASHGHGGHEDLDLTHADASANLEDPSEIRSDKTLYTLVVFALLLVGLYLVAWKPIMEGLGKREADINALISKTEKASEDAAAKLREYELKLQSAAQEAQALIAQARKDAEVSGQRIVADAQAEAARQRSQALAEIESAKRVAIGDLSTKSTELAFTLAKRIVGRELKQDDHQQLISEVLNQFPSRN